MIFPVDSFNGKSDGEDLFYKKMNEFLPKKFVSFHNQNIGMEEADVVMLIPDKGILVVEIKSFRPKNISKAKDNKYILKTNGEVVFSPFKQAARYRNSLVEKLKACNSKYEKYVVAYVPCFPYFTEQDLLEKEMGRICDINLFINQSDLQSFENFLKRLGVIFECANKLNIPGLKRNYFPATDIINVGNIIMPHSLDEKFLEFFNEVKETEKQENDNEYSHLYVKCDEEIESDEACERIINQWKKGVKIYYYSNNRLSVNKITDMLEKEVLDFNLKAYSEKYDELNTCRIKEKFGYFNFSIEFSLAINESYEIVNGVLDESARNRLIELGKHVRFNAEQYFAEHAESKDMLVNAGAGTGKTYLLVSRIAYLIWKHQYCAKELGERIALITFTNDATDEMRSRLESYFSKMFLLTINKKYYEYIECVENMEISTIDSFSKKIVSKFAYNIGLGKDLKVTSATLLKQKCIREEINDYLVNEKKSSELAISSYEMTKRILDLIKKLEDRNKDYKKIQDLFEKTFAMQARQELDPQTASDYELVQKDLAAMFLRVPNIMSRVEKECNKRNQILMGQIIVYLSRISDALKSGEIRKPTAVKYDYIFIDEFQDTDDQQITLLSEFQKLFGFKYFVVGDVKQSIYRFRGAKDDRAFSYLDSLCEERAQSFHLVKNYRTNVRMLNYFDRTFQRLSSKKGNRSRKGLLSYTEKDVLVGVHNPDYPEEIHKYYFSTEEEREHFICEVVRAHTHERGTMAILVRKNHQIAEIKRICQKNEIHNVDIDTAGSLYQHEASIDLFKLVYALQNYTDEAALFNLYTTSYANSSVDKNGLMNAEDKLLYFRENLPSSLKKWEDYIQNLQVQPVLKVIREIIDDVRPWDLYSQRLMCKDTEREIATLRYRNNLEKLFEKIAVETNGMYLTINAFVESLRIMITTSQEEEERAVTENFDIQCRTIHRAKGKEYDYVFMPYADDTFEKGKPQNMNTFIISDAGIGYCLSIDGNSYHNEIYTQEEASDREDQSYEEARIFYVALTRAKKGIIYLETAKKNRNQTSWCEILKET